MALHFVTAKRGTDHVESYNAAHLYAGILGNGEYVLPVRGQMKPSMTDSNTLRILGGDFVCCGRHVAIDGDWEEVSIDNGVPGYNRIDLVVARISTAPSETAELVVIRGDETTGTPVVPGHVSGDLNDGDTVCEVPICSVLIEGINPQEPVSLLSGSATVADLEQEVSKIWDALAQASADTGWVDLYYVPAQIRIRARRVGSTVCITGESIGYYDIGGNKWINLTTVPERFRPSKRTEVPFNLGTAAGVRAYLEETGEFYVTCTASSCATWGCCVCFPV